MPVRGCRWWRACPHRLGAAIVLPLVLAACGGAPIAPPTPALDIADSSRPDRACRSDADCQIKNVGNCCGQMPACVNRHARTDPDAVRAACAKSGLAGVCGFRVIDACRCERGQCQDVQHPPGGGPPEYR